MSDLNRRTLGLLAGKIGRLPYLLAFVLFSSVNATAEPEQNVTLRASQHTNGIFGRLAQNRPPLQAYDNYDLTGPTGRTLSDVELQGCSDTCQSDNQCQAFSYDKWQRQCFLKQALGSLRFEPRFTSGIASNATPPPMSNEPIVMVCSKERITAQSGFRLTPNSSFEQCQKSCEGDGDCVAFMFAEARLQCSIFRSVDAVVTDQAVISGLKRQTGNSDVASCAAFVKNAIPTEDDVYRAARGDIIRLRTYLKTCSTCSFANEAREEIVTLDRQQRDVKERETYEAARGDELKLLRYLLSCSICANANEAREGVNWFEQQRARAPQSGENEAPPRELVSRAMCSSDALRLCSDFIPDVAKVVNCMRTNYQKLSEACRRAVAPSARQR